MMSNGVVNDYDQEIDVQLQSTNNVQIDLSKFRNVNLELKSYDTNDEIDLDHPYLPREYQVIRLGCVKLTGKFERKIKVKCTLYIDDEMNTPSVNLWKNYFLYLDRCVTHYCVQHFVPFATQNLLIQNGNSPFYMTLLLDYMPKLRLFNVDLRSEGDMEKLLVIVREHIHRLSPAIIKGITFNGPISRNTVGRCVKIMDNWFTNYSLAVCLYTINKRYGPGLFQPLLLLKHERYL